MSFDAKAEALLDLCRRKDLSLATVESCTGGMVAAALTEIPGSSDVIIGGFVTYSNDAKMTMVGVRGETLETDGAVSEATAVQMAEGGRGATSADISVSVTGIAGPGGGSDKKPVGMVCFAVSSQDGTRAITKIFPDEGRQAIRSQSVAFALDLLMEEAQRHQAIS